MAISELGKSRITNKFRNSSNFNKILDFLIEKYDLKENDIELIRGMKNIDIDNSYILDKLGEILGVARPLLKIGTTTEGYFQLDTTGFDNLPLADEGDVLDVRLATNKEYGSILKAISKLSLFRGTLDDVASFYGELSDSKAYIINGQSTYDIVFFKELTSFEKALIEYLSGFLDILTLERGFLGTAEEGAEIFRFDVGEFDEGSFINPW